MRTSRVLLLVTDLERGGTPLRLARLASGLRERGLEVHVGCLARPGPVSRDLDAAGIPNFACNACRVRDVGALWRLVGHVRRIRPDVIHSTLTHANVAARIVGLLCGVPVVTSTATIEVERKWHAWAERLSAGFGHIVNSEAVADHVRRVFAIRAGRFVIPPSIDLPGSRAAVSAGVAPPAAGVAPPGAGDSDRVVVQQLGLPATNSQSFGPAGWTRSSALIVLECASGCARAVPLSDCRRRAGTRAGGAGARARPDICSGWGGETTSRR